MSYNKERQVKHVTDQMVELACYKSLIDKMDKKYTKNTCSFLAEIADVPWKVAQAKLRQCADRGLIEWGGSLENCWWIGAARPPKDSQNQTSRI